MKQLLLQYAAYNLWADDLLMKTLEALPEDILRKETGSSFGNIYNTVFHLMETETIWFQRLQLAEPVLAPQKDSGENFMELSKKLSAVSKQWSDWISEATENKLNHVFGYQNSKKEFFKQPVWQVVMHVFNHQTFHRGQIITMMRQTGVDKIPATDFIVFCRKSIR